MSRAAFPFRFALAAAAFAAAASVHAAAPDVFVRQCAPCHGADGRGGERAPAAAGRERNEAAIADLIRTGIPNRGMPGFSLSGAQMADVVAFVRSIPAARTDGRVRLQLSPLPFERIKTPASGDWPTYHGQLSGNRHSALTQVTPSNVGRLAMRWMFTVPNGAALQVTPIVVDGTMYVTNVNACYALDAANGKLLWQFRRDRTKGLAGDAAGGINRGVAVLENRVFMVTDNAHLLALDRSNGSLLWETTMADSRENYGATSAPLVTGDLVVSGISGGDEGVRGFLAAFDVTTGKEVWRFWTVPRPGEPLAETWRGTAIEHGCATTWLTGTFDPASNTLYWPTGNPCPDYNGDHRQGDNLYSDSILALDPQTGTLRWHYQFTPHDLHDWDAQQTPMLVDAAWDGQQQRRKLLLQANRNGFFYVLDRTSGNLLRAVPFVQNMTWAREVGTDGRPVLLPGNQPTKEGVKVCPAVEGATNWMSSAFSPELGLFFVSALEKCSIFTKTEETWKAGESFYAGGTRDLPEDKGQKVLRAIDYRSGRIVWSHAQEGQARSWSGLLSTTSGLVFYGSDNGAFEAVDARNGRTLWSFQANQNWKASPMTYTTRATQHIAIAGGPSILVFALPATSQP